jgi:uncharacterized protein YbjT (DUF2867 family)
MSTSNGSILAIGAAGPNAGLVVPALAERGARVRAFIREPEEERLVRSRGAAEVAVGDLRDKESLLQAMQGAEGLFYLAPAFQPDEAEFGKAAVAAAIEAGVRRIVFSSVIHPTLGALANHAAKAPVEQAIFESGLQYVILQPAMFFQNFAEVWSRVMQTGVYAEPWSAETRFSRVDYRDVAEAAAIALTEDRLLFGTFELAAEGWLNRIDVAGIMGEVLGKTVAVGTVNRATAAGEKQARDHKNADGVRRMVAWYDRHPLLGNSLTLRAILGREPRTLKAYFEELATQGER